MIKVRNIYLMHHFPANKTGRLFLDPSQAIEYVVNFDGTISLKFTNVETMPDAPQGTSADEMTINHPGLHRSRRDSDD